MKVLQAIFNFLYEILLGCRHDRLTRPFTLQQQTYKVCLDCGKHVFYSTDTMRPLSGRELRRLRAMQASELKVLPAAKTAASLNGENNSRAVA
ncbi:MAG TPA: hypothetical protein VK798_03870 [Alloacidobacterium sp.]|jgi:hypothetical protein|nr:hypothetical protein [Alloacidobacterium sp.]